VDIPHIRGAGPAGNIFCAAAILQKVNTLIDQLLQTTDQRREFLLALVAAALFSVESWILGPYSWMYGYGAGLETIPTHLALLHDHRLFSTWAPFIAGGLDRFAFWGNADPLNWEAGLLTVFPVWLANGVHRFAQYFVAIYFATKIMREQLGLNCNQALLGGLLYGSFSYFTFGEMLAVPGLPMFLWLMQHSRDSKRGPWLPLLIGLGFSTFTTFTHSVPYFVAFAALWSVAVLRDLSWRAATNLGFIAIGLTIGDLPQLLAALANAASSHRVGFPQETVDWTMDGLFYRALRFDYFNQDQLAKKIAWDLPLPLLTAGAILVALTNRRPATPLAAMYLRIYAVYFLLSQRWLFVVVQNAIGAWVPPVNGIYMGRFYDMPASFLIACQLGLLIGLAREKFGEAKWPTRAVTATVVALIAFMLVQPKLFLFYRNGVDGWGEKNYQVKALDQLVRTETEPFRVASVLPLQPAYAYAQGFETADGWANLYPKVYREYWLRVLAPLFRNVPGAKEIFDPDTGKPQDHYIFLGADLIHPTAGALPGEDPKLAAIQGFDIDRRFNLKLLGLLNVKYLLSEFPLKGRGIELVHAPANPPRTAYSRDWATGLLSPPSGPRGANVVQKVRNAWPDLRDAIQRKAQGKDIFIYKLADSVERFRLVQTLHVEKDAKAVLDRLSSSDATALRSSAVLEATDARNVTQRQNLAGGQIELTGYRPDRIDLTVTTAGDAFLVMASTWSPFWTATVDGRGASLIRTNHVQYGLPLAPGSHKVSLAYRPPYSLLSQ
jgi:hypothetical protein